MAEELQAGDPESVGPYRLLGRLGTGGMGQVYLARSPGARLTAVKVIRPELVAEPGFRARFAREVASARTVSGIFTAPVLDADPEGPRPWLATAYIPGPSLAEAVTQRGPLPPAGLLSLGAGLAEGLQAIHAAGLVHRDLKPSNVLLADDGPRIIDFGIARAVDSSSLTQTGMVIGSPGFLSPEQAEGHPVGPAGDIFSLGALLVFAASGAGPFGSGTVAALVYRVVNSEPNLSGVPEPLRPVIARCLAKNPAQRPGAGELLTLLGAVPAAPAPASPAPGPGYASSYQEPPPAPAYGTAPAMNAGGPNRPPATAPGRRGGPPGPHRDGPPRKRGRLAIIAAVVVIVGAVARIALATGGHDHRGAAAGTPAASVTASSNRSTALPGNPTAQASPAASAASSPAAGVPVAGVWKGTYTCNQGLTGVELTITGSSGDSVMATVDFYPVAGNPGTASGSYETVGRYSASGGLVLNPDYWIDQPPGYEMVGLTAPPPGGSSMSGTVRGVGCTTFSVSR